MCGIVGYVGNSREVVPIIIEGLRRLEYRGYDSAGIAVGGNGDGLQLRRAPGKLRNLEEVLRERPLEGTFGIGHTRWATHGRPTEENAHPHRDCTGRLVVVHNGIVENYLDLKHELIGQGHKFVTETDTEVIAHLIEQELATAAKAGKPLPLEEAVRMAVKRLTGAFAIGVLSADEPNKIVAARIGAAGGYRGRRGRIFRRVRCAGNSAPHAGPLFSGRWRYGHADAGRGEADGFRWEADRAAASAHSVGSDPGGKGRLQAFHAQGNL